MGISELTSTDVSPLLAAHAVCKGRALTLHLVYTIPGMQIQNLAAIFTAATYLRQVFPRHA